MRYLPEKDYNLPDIDLLSFLFDSPLSWSEENTVLHAEAAHPSNQITKAETRTFTKRLGHVFRHQFGIGQHGSGKDAVVCMSSGQILIAPVLYGVIAAGGIFSSASNAFTVPELVRQIKQGDASVIVVSEDCKDIATRAARECGISPARVLVLDSSQGKRSLIDIAGHGRNYLTGSDELEWERVTDPKVLAERLICLLYSSGTTGVPKGVNLSHQNIVTQALIPTLQDREFFLQKKETEPTYHFSSVTVAHLPTAHIAGCQGYLINPILAGGLVYWMTRFEFPSFLEYSRKYKATYFITVPPIYLLIAKSPLVTDHFKTLEFAVSGAAPLGAELQALAEKKMGCHIMQTWGLSETTGSFTKTPRGQHDPSGGVGPLLPNTRLRVVDDEGRDVEEGQRGEFIIKGPMVTTGYYRNDQATRESFTSDGWFQTGDIGVRKNGNFYIVDRKKELIKYKGLQVAPAELEALLLSHDYILDAAVIGVPDPDGSGNELPRAYVVADKSKLSEQDIKDFVKSRAASHKQLRGGVVWLDVIPKSPSGKILRRNLREMAKQEQRPKQSRL